MRRKTFREAGAVLTLEDRGTHHELRIGDVPILTSALLGTERDFGRLVPSSARRVLVGGLGFGATLAGVLETVGPDARVLVVEKLRTVVDLVRPGGALAHLTRGALAHLTRGALDDPRVELVRADVRAVIAREQDLDAILLDVDNGPEWASFRSNAGLYDRRGLATARRALRPGGMWAVWSGYPVDAFVDRLREAGFRASVAPFRERGKVQARAYVGVVPWHHGSSSRSVGAPSRSDGVRDRRKRTPR
jgi:predicted membrane-bound spermidine synthase